MKPLNPNEPLIPLSRAARRLPGRLGPGGISPRTLTRWIVNGALSARGHRVYLEAVRCGSRWLTTERSMEDFMKALTDHVNVEDQPAGPRSPAARTKESCAAAEELKRLGA